MEIFETLHIFSLGRTFHSLMCECHKCKVAIVCLCVREGEGGAMGHNIAGISWKFSYAKTATSFAGTIKSFAGIAFCANIKRKIEASYQPVDLICWA